MLSPVGVVDQWRAIRQGLPDRDADLRIANQWRATEHGLPAGWGEARLRLNVADNAEAARAAALLGPVNATRRGTVIWIHVSRVGGGAVPDLVVRLFARLDREGIEGKLELAEVSQGPQPVVQRQLPTLVEQGEKMGAELPDDWSDLWLEIELTSSDHLERGALLLAPVNPARAGKRLAYRFRVARRFGYGASPEMFHRCLERLDGEGIGGTLRILHALSDTKPVSTQGPVWYVGGRSV